MGAGRGGIPRRLTRAAARFREWRRSTPLGSRIPEGLWAVAVRLADRYGVSKTAKVLILDYYALKRRLEAMPRLQAMPVEDPASGELAEFVEVPASEWPLPAIATASAGVPTPPGECLVELEDNRGTKLRLHLKGLPVSDLVALSVALWSSHR